MGSENKSGAEQTRSFAEIYARAESKKDGGPRTSIFRFGSREEFWGSAGKLFAQGVISWFLVGALNVFLYLAYSEWVNQQTSHMLLELVKLASATVSVFLVSKVFDDNGIEDLGIKVTRQSLFDFVIGFSISFFVLTSGLLFVLATGLGRINGYVWQENAFSMVVFNIFLSFVIFCFVGWSEELVSRGFQLRIISKGLNRPLGVLLSSVVFSYMHRFVTGITPLGYMLMFFYGLLFSLAVIRTGNLWLTIGLHSGWDFFLTAFWGSGMSDMRVFALFDVRTNLHSWTFYLIILFEIMAAALLVYLLTMKRKVDTLDW